MSEKMTAREIAYDVFSVPNAMTTLRLAAIPWLYKLVKKNPGKYWGLAGVLASTDKLDGLAAAQEDKGPQWAKWGFRRSNFGRIEDPVVDTAFGAAMIDAGMKGEGIPKRLGRAGLIQKAAKAVVSVYGTVTGHELHVSYTGKLGEACTVVGFGTRMGSEGIKNPAVRSIARFGSEVLTWAGIGLATTATVGYARDAEILPTERSAFEDRVEQVSERIVNTPRMIMEALRGPNELNTTPEM